MTLEAIKAAVESGLTVHWCTPGYRVIKAHGDQWLIECVYNGHCIGLTWRDGVTMNGKPKEFYVPTAPSPEELLDGPCAPDSERTQRADYLLDQAKDNRS